MTVNKQPTTATAANHQDFIFGVAGVACSDAFFAIHTCPLLFFPRHALAVFVGPVGNSGLRLNDRFSCLVYISFGFIVVW